MVLVLAVAGLIFLVVFSAIPRLQASRRDNQRKRDMEQIVAAMIEYQSNTGSVPYHTVLEAALESDSGAFYDYIDEGGDLRDPSGSRYVHEVVGAAALDDPGDLRLVNYATYDYYCNSSNTSWAYGGRTKTTWTLLLRLERGYACYDGQG